MFGNRQNITIVLKGQDEVSPVINIVNRNTDGMRRKFFSLRSAAVAAIGGYVGYRGMQGAINVAADFEMQLARVNTMLSAGQESFMPAYEMHLKKLAASYGQSTQTLSDGLYDILSASVPASKAMDVLTVATQSAIGGFTDTAVAVDGITTLLNAYKLTAESANGVSDLMFRTVKAGKLTFADLAQNIGMVAPQASTANVSLQTLLAMVSTMTRQGLSTEQAVVRVNRVIETFTKNSDAQREAAKKWGVTLDESAISGDRMLEVMRQLQGLSLTQLGEIFSEKRAVSGASVLSSDVKGFARDIKMMADAAGSRMEALGKVQDSLRIKLRRLREGGKNLLLRVMEPMMPVLDLLLDKLLQVGAWVERQIPRVEAFVRDMVGRLDPLIKKLKELKNAAIDALRQFGEYDTTQGDPFDRLVTAAGIAALKIKHELRRALYAGTSEALTAIAQQFPFLYSIGAMVGGRQSFAEWLTTPESAEDFVREIRAKQALYLGDEKQGRRGRFAIEYEQEIDRFRADRNRQSIQRQQERMERERTQAAVENMMGFIRGDLIRVRLSDGSWAYQSPRPMPVPMLQQRPDARTEPREAPELPPRRKVDQQLDPLIARFLTSAPGQDPVRRTEEHTKATSEHTKAIKTILEQLRDAIDRVYARRPELAIQEIAP